MKRLKLKTKGSLQDLVLIVVVAFVFAIVMLFSFKIVDVVNTRLQVDPNIPDTARAASTSMLALFPGIIDNIFLFLLVGMSAAALALASLVRIHPVFIAFYLFALILVIVIAGALSNVYQEMAAHAEFISLSSQLIFINLLLTFLPFIIGVIGSILAIVMYKQWSNANI